MHTGKITSKIIHTRRPLTNINTAIMPSEILLTFAIISRCDTRSPVLTSIWSAMNTDRRCRLTRRWNCSWLYGLGWCMADWNWWNRGLVGSGRRHWKQRLSAVDGIRNCISWSWRERQHYSCKKMKFLHLRFWDIIRPDSIVYRSRRIMPLLLYSSSQLVIFETVLFHVISMTGYQEKNKYILNDHTIFIAKSLFKSHFQSVGRKIVRSKVVSRKVLNGWSKKILMWSKFEIIHIWTAQVNESEEWSSQLIISYILHIIPLLTGDMNSINWPRS